MTAKVTPEFSAQTQKNECAKKEARVCELPLSKNNCVKIIFSCRA